MRRLGGWAAFTALWFGVSMWHPAALAQPAGRAGSSGFTVAGVIKLVQSGLSEDIIIEQIRRKGHPLDLSSDQIIELKAAHVSDRIVEALLDPAKAKAPPPLAPFARGDAPPPAPSAMDAAVPAEVGAYARKRDRWVALEPETVYWKTAGAVKTIVTAGIHHGDAYGRVPGRIGSTSLDRPASLLIVAPEGVAMAEYRLVRLRRDKEEREFRIATGGLRGTISFDGRKIAGHVYEVDFPASAGPGEYGLLPPGAASGTGKIYSFRVLE